MNTTDKFRFAMAQALDDVDSIECTDKERVEGLDVMQDLLIEHTIAVEEREQEAEVLYLADYR